MIDWTKILTNSFSIAVIGGLLIWLIKSDISNFLDKSLEKYKEDLKNESENYRLELDKELEAYKSNLSFQFLKDELIHNKRLVLMSSLYEKAVELQFAMGELTQIFKRVEEDFDKEEKERISKAGDAYNSFFKTYKRNKILIPEDSCEIVEELSKAYYDSLWDHSYEQRMGVKDRDKKRAAYEKMKNEIPDLLENLEQNFRSELETNNR